MYMHERLRIIFIVESSADVEVSFVHNFAVSDSSEMGIPGLV